MSHEDDLQMWDDDPLVRALRAPGTAAELSGQDDALAAFRAAVPKRSRRRIASRMGTGAGTLVVAVALSSGVAAAYTHTLPDRVQRVAHSWFGEIGVGAPTTTRALAGHRPRPHPTHGPGSPAIPVARPSTAAPGPTSGTPHSGVPAPAATSTSTSTRAVTRPTGRPSPAATASAPVKAAPLTSAKPSPVASAPPSKARLIPAAMTGSASAQRVQADSGVTMSGQLTARSGAAVPNRRVVVQSRSAGAHQRWSRVGSARTGSDGRVTIDVPALSRTTRLRLVAPRGVHSPVATVVVDPTLAVSLTRQGRSYAVTITSAGLQPGDRLTVSRRLRGHRSVVDRVTVDGSGDAGFTVAVPRKRTVTFRVVTPRSAAHAAASTTFVAPHR